MARKKVSYTLIPKDGDFRTEPVLAQAMYQLLARLVEDHHEELVNARIALAWCTSWKADPDGRMTIGKCKKASDLDRELAAWDFVILLDKWTWAEFSEAQRAALLDHELCHATRKLDKSFDPMEDERGRAVWRTRKHDIEEFADIVTRHGCYKRDLEQFAAALARGQQLKLPVAAAAEATPPPAPKPARTH